MLVVPLNDTKFEGWNAVVVLQWSSGAQLAAKDYYVVRIPYDDAGGVAEFWRKETSFQVPAHFSKPEVGFPDRHYNWSVQVMRCIELCEQVLDDNVKKQGTEMSLTSQDRLFYWYPGIGGWDTPTPTKDPP